MTVVEPVKARERVFGIEKLFRIAALAIGHLSGRFTTAALCSATGRFTTAALRLLTQLLLTDHFLWPIHFLTLYNHLKNPQIKLCGFFSTELKITQVIIEKDFIYPETFKQRNNTIDI